MTIETIIARRKQKNSFKVLGKKNCKTTFPYPMNVPFLYEGEIKTFSNERKPKKKGLKILLKLLRQNRNDMRRQLAT